MKMRFSVPFLFLQQRALLSGWRLSRRSAEAFVRLLEYQDLDPNIRSTHTWGIGFSWRRRGLGRMCASLRRIALFPYITSWPSWRRRIWRDRLEWRLSARSLM